MKKYIIGLITGIFLFTPILTYSAPSLAARLKGRLLLAVEDKGKVFYVAPDGYRYQVTRATAQKIFEKLSLGISNKNLEQIPVNEVKVEVEPEVMPEPQVAGESVKTIEKIIYVDRYLDKQCPDNSNLIESYKNEINDLRNQVENLKTNWDIKGQQSAQSIPVVQPVPESKIDWKSLLNKEYALTINRLQKKVLDLQSEYARAETIVKANNPGWNSLNLPDMMNTFQRQKRAEIDSLNREIASLQNELARKLLELE